MVRKYNTEAARTQSMIFKSPREIRLEKALTSIKTELNQIRDTDKLPSTIKELIIEECEDIHYIIDTALEPKR